MSDDKLRALAEEAEKAGDRAAAIRLYSQILQQEPEDVDVRVRRAMLWSSVGESHLALGDLDKALQIRPQSPALFLRRASVWLEAQKYVRCERELTALLNLVEWPGARTWRAEIRLAYGDVFGALSDLGDVLRKDPFNEDALKWYAFAKGQIAAQQITKLSKKEEKMPGSWWKGITPPEAEVPKVKTSTAAAGPLRVDVDVARWPSGARLEISIVQPQAAPKNKASRKAAGNEAAAAEGDKPAMDT